MFKVLILLIVVVVVVRQLVDFFIVIVSISVSVRCIQFSIGLLGFRSLLARVPSR